MNEIEKAYNDIGWEPTEKLIEIARYLMNELNCSAGDAVFSLGLFPGRTFEIHQAAQSLVTPGSNLSDVFTSFKDSFHDAIPDTAGKMKNNHFCQLFIEFLCAVAVNSDSSKLVFLDELNKNYKEFRKNV